DVVEERANPTVTVAREHDHAVLLLASADRVERHGEPALGRAVEPRVRDALELLERRVVDLVEPVPGRGEALTLRARHRLAHLADRASFERERRRLDDRLVADVERAQP